MIDTKWDLRFLALAKHVSTWSKDPSTQVGAVLVRPDRTVESLGFNGFPRGMNDDPERYADRDTKYKYIVHGEMNAILSASDTKGCTLYLWPFLSCERCAVHVIQAGITRVVCPENDNPRWADALAVSARMFEESMLDVTTYPKSMVTL